MAERAHAPDSIRKRTSFLRLCFVGSLLAVAACTDKAPPTGPTTPLGPRRSQTTAGNVEQNGTLSQVPNTLGACHVVVRGSNGQYQGRSVILTLPKNIASSKAGIAEFIYRGWERGVAEPAVLADCSMPDASSARTYFEKIFGGKSMNPAELRSFAEAAGVSGVEYWGGTGISYVRGAGPTYVIDGLASESPAKKPRATDGEPSAMLIPVDGCDPTAIIPEPGCPGYVPEDEYVPDTPPPSDGTPQYIPGIPVSPFGPPPAAYCDIKTDNPHVSTKYLTGLRLNVKGWTECNVPLPQSINVVLGRQRCFVANRICWWSQIDDKGNPGNYTTAGPAYLATTNASAACLWAVGWYMGKSTHNVVRYGYTVTWHTQSEWIGIKCA